MVIYLSQMRRLPLWGLVLAPVTPVVPGGAPQEVIREAGFPHI